MSETTRPSGRDIAETMSNADKVVFNEVQKNFFRKDSAYFGSVDLNYPCGGSKMDMKQFYGSPAAADPGDLCPAEPAASSPKAPRTERLVQIKGVGFDLLYTRDGCSAQQPSVREINVETPCKLVMAVVLVAYILNRHMQPADQVDSFFGAILDACKCALCGSTPLALAKWWLGGGGQPKVQELPKTDSQTSGYGDRWSAQLRKFTGAFGQSRSSGAAETAPVPKWSDKVGSLFKRVRA